MDGATDDALDDREEPLELWMRRALLTMEEGEGADGPLAVDWRLLDEPAEDLLDEREEPVRPWIRRVLLAIEEGDEPEGAFALSVPLLGQTADDHEGAFIRSLQVPAQVGDESDDEEEEPIRGPLRRALLAVDP
jgi:hypothetical protein